MAEQKHMWEKTMMHFSPQHNILFHKTIVLQTKWEAEREVVLYYEHSSESSGFRGADCPGRSQLFSHVADFHRRYIIKEEVQGILFKDPYR